MKTLIAVLVLLLIPVSMPVRGEAVTLLEIDSAWALRFDTARWCWVDYLSIDMIPRTFIVPEWDSAQMYTTHFVYVHDTVRIVDTVCPCDHEWEWECIDNFGQTKWMFLEQCAAYGPGWDNPWHLSYKSRCIYCGAVRKKGK